MESQPVLSKNLDVSLVDVSEPKGSANSASKSKNGSKFANVLYNKKFGFKLNTPKLLSKFGAQCSTDIESKDNQTGDNQQTPTQYILKYTLHIDLSSNPDFNNQLNNFDDQILKSCANHTTRIVDNKPEKYIPKGDYENDETRDSTWANPFNSTNNTKQSKQVIPYSMFYYNFSQRFKKGVKVPKDQNSMYGESLSPVFKFKEENGVKILKTEVYDSSRKRINANLDVDSDLYIKKVITNNTYCVLLLQPSLWVVDATGFGIKWSIDQVIVFPSEATLTKGMCMIQCDEVTESQENDNSSKTFTDHPKNNKDIKDNLIAEDPISNDEDPNDALFNE